MMAVGAVVCLITGAVILELIRLLFVMCSIQTLGHLLGITHPIHMIVGWVAIPLLFVGYLTISGAYLTTYESGDLFDKPTDRYVYLPGWGLFPRDPRDVVNIFKMIIDCLFLGPRLVLHPIHIWRVAGRLGRLDVDSCARVLGILAQAGGKVPFVDILHFVPDLDQRVFIQLRDIDGVLFLEVDPPGLTLKPELRETLQELD